MYKLIIFDWDGTLMDSEARIVSCLAAAISDLRLATRPPAQLRDVIGLGMREAIARMYPDMADAMAGEFVDRYRYHFITADTTPSELFTGAAQTVKTLADSGYYLAVATGKGRRGLDSILTQTGLAQYFHVTRCADETRSKPHPQMLEEILDALGMYPADAVMVGDTEYDMEMAHNAQVDAIAVTYGVHDHGRLHRHQPVASIDAISQLPGVVAGLRRGDRRADS